MDMNIQKFEDTVDLYGADLSKWPVADMKAALAFMASSPAAKSYFDDMVTIETALRTIDKMPQSTAALENRILQKISGIAQAPSHAPTFRQPPQLLNFRPQFLFAPGGGLIALAVIGFLTGFQMKAEAHDYILDPVYYMQDQIIAGDDPVIEGDE